MHGRLEAHPAHPTRYCVPRAKAATTAERHALSACAERLEAELAPWRRTPPGADRPTADHLAVDAIVTRILTGFEQGRGRSDDETDVLVGEYLDGLKGFPLAAIHAAAERYRNDTTLEPRNRRFRPSPGEFAAEVRKGLIALRTRLLHVRRVLDAEVYDPPTEADAAKVREATAAYLSGRGFPTDGGRPAPAPEEVTAAREASLREMGAAAARSFDAGTLARLNARLDARRP
ncbi:hypothetical protein ACFZ8E_25030 [Methylobacterium sp. HMF5984]|uniref:hypothetical protein n=1 Tax=Methylobacterium sp. HMF5984 TaxID=3367370 RepID=UPI0038519C5E